ncbi:hypothetical protein ACFLSV_06450 [Bacteroidota bacterium]
MLSLPVSTSRAQYEPYHVIPYIFVILSPDLSGRRTQFIVCMLESGVIPSHFVIPAEAGI